MTLAPLAMTIAFMGSRSGAVRGPLDLGVQSYMIAHVYLAAGRLETSVRSGAMPAAGKALASWLIR
jgi:hypothetical protein